MENTTKITKAMKFEMLKAILEVADVEEADKAMLVEFCDDQLNALAVKAAKAKEQAIQKKAESDALTSAIADVLTSEYQTVNEIMVNFTEDEEITKAKIVSRLGKLVRDNVAEKETVKDGDNKKVVAYRLVTEG
jgi:hypothetical protein